MLTAAKTAWWFWWKLLAKSIFQEIFEGEMYIRILPTTLLQMFSKSILNFWVIAGFDLSGCPGGIHALKFVRPTQDWLSFIISDRPKTDQKNFLKSIPVIVKNVKDPDNNFKSNS